MWREAVEEERLEVRVAGMGGSCFSWPSLASWLLPDSFSAVEDRRHLALVPAPPRLHPALVALVPGAEGGGGSAGEVRPSSPSVPSWSLLVSRVFSILSQVTTKSTVIAPDVVFPWRSARRR